MKLLAVLAATAALASPAFALSPKPTDASDTNYLTQSKFTPAQSPIDIHFELPADCSSPVYYKCKGDLIPKNGASVSIENNAIVVTIAEAHQPNVTLPSLKVVERPTTAPPPTSKKPHRKYGYDDDDDYYDDDDDDYYHDDDDDDDYYRKKRPTRPPKPGKLQCRLTSFKFVAISQHTVYKDHNPLEIELLHKCQNDTTAIISQLYQVMDFGPDPKPTYKPTKHYRKPTRKGYYKKDDDKKDDYKKDDDKKGDKVERYLALAQEEVIKKEEEKRGKGDHDDDDKYKRGKDDDDDRRYRKKRYDDDDDDYDHYDDDDDDYYGDKDIYYKKDSEISLDDWNKEATIIIKKIVNEVAAKLVNVTTVGSGYSKTYVPVLLTGPVKLPFKFKAKFLSYFGKGTYAYAGSTTWSNKANSDATVFVPGQLLTTDVKAAAFTELVHALGTKRPYEFYNNHNVVPLGISRPVWKFCGTNCTQEWDPLPVCPTPVKPTKRPTYRPTKDDYDHDDKKGDHGKKDDHDKKDDYDKPSRY